jgi:TonB family protein
MSRRKTRREQRNGWAWAAVGSSVVHALVLVALIRGGRRELARSADAVVVELTAELAWDPSRIGLVPLPTKDEAALARPLDAPQGERDNAVSKTVGPRDSDGRDPTPPATDQGLEGGHPLEAATRRDRSTLQSHVADSTDDAQPSRLRTGRRLSSPQAVRREVVTGVGDSVHTSDPTRAPGAAQPEDLPAPGLPPDVAGPAAGSKVAARVEPLTLARASEDPDPDRGVGPLAAESGARLFDTETRGRAVDNKMLRAASSESHPGITDFSHAGVAADADSLQGHGPGNAPGAVARATNGTAPTVFGARNPQELAADVAERTRERQYDRYRQEIQRRIQNVLVFPRGLAVRLEQGEAVVTFVVRPDGGVADGPRVVKSSGFQEFDAEAVKAVLRAAPFPRRSETSGIALSMPVTFENPLVR